MKFRVKPGSVEESVLHLPHFRPRFEGPLGVS